MVIPFWSTYVIQNIPKVPFIGLYRAKLIVAFINRATNNIPTMHLYIHTNMLTKFIYKHLYWKITGKRNAITNCHVFCQTHSTPHKIPKKECFAQRLVYALNVAFGATNLKDIHNINEVNCVCCAAYRGNDIEVGDSRANRMIKQDIHRHALKLHKC